MQLYPSLSLAFSLLPEDLRIRSSTNDLNAVTKANSALRCETPGKNRKKILSHNLPCKQGPKCIIKETSHHLERFLRFRN